MFMVGKNFAARSEIATVGQNRARSSKLVEKFMSAAPSYNPDVEWWNIAAENPARVLGDMDEDMILSQNSKLIAG